MISIDRRAADLFVKPGMTVYDMGTFIGTTAASYLARGAAAVYAFEPLPRNRERIPADLRSDPRFHLLPLALSEAAGTTTLKIPLHNDGGGEHLQAAILSGHRPRRHAALLRVDAAVLGLDPPVGVRGKFESLVPAEGLEPPTP